VKVKGQLQLLDR